MKLPFWEETYKDDNVSTFGREPNQAIKEYEYLFDKSWNVLEVGCEEGKNPICLARMGFLNIDAFDLSENGIAKLSELQKRMICILILGYRTYVNFNLKKNMI